MHTRDGLCVFSIEVAVPVAQAARLAHTLTGNDNDAILAAETALRGAVGRDYSEPELELSLADGEDELKRFLRDEAVAAGIPTVAEEERATDRRERGVCAICGDDRCQPDLCESRVVVIEHTAGDAEVVDHLIARPIVLTADHIELTIAALIDFHAGAHNPTAILVVDKNGWKLADEWKETRDPQEVGR